jgi:putative membrane protein
VRYRVGVQLAAGAVIVLVAALHVYFLFLEMFLWRTPVGRRTFGTTAEFAEASAVLAANQGLYNGFLAAGLLWALLFYGLATGRPVLSFFLACIVVAGVYGAWSVNRRILFVQAVPAVIALVVLWLV